MKIKCITFDKKAQNNLPQEIKDRMKADREKMLEQVREETEKCNHEFGEKYKINPVSWNQDCKKCDLKRFGFYGKK